MDKEAQEKIKDILTRYGNFMDGYDVGDELDIDEAFTAIKKALKGYRKPKEKPPLLDEEYIKRAITIQALEEHKSEFLSHYDMEDSLEVAKRLLQAQWDICVKHYKEE